jgi:hypothetical protein
MGDRRARQTGKRWSLASSPAIFSWASAIFILLPTPPSAFIHHALIIALLSPQLTPTRFLAMASALRTHEEADFSERDPLLKQRKRRDDAQVSQRAVPIVNARRLYLSHFLSAWNSRVFEFGAVLYLATVFPGTLLPMSVYAFARAVSAIVFAPAVGQYIDTGNRLQVVRVSIGMSFSVLYGNSVLTVSHEWSSDLLSPLPASFSTSSRSICH